MDRDYFVFTFTQGYLFRLYFIVLYSTLSAWLRFEIEIVLLKSAINVTVCYKDTCNQAVEAVCQIKKDR